MGTTISYRGSLKDLSRVEDFEDRVLDLALELGGQARIWRTSSDDDPRRVVRGVVLNLYPGQETTSLLIAPEGWLINLCEIEEAEKGQLIEPPWCFVKTQFGPVEGHVALVEMLAALKQEFLPDLEVHDEGEYWETRNLATLTAKIEHLQAAIDAMAEGLNRHGLNREAAEDQEILVARIERIARLVHRTLARPAEHPPVHWEDEDSGINEMESDESRWDASFKENRRRQEHVQRAIEEHLAGGDNIDEAFDAAMQEETALGLPEEPAEELPGDWTEDFQAEDDEPWRESLPEAICEADEVGGLTDRHPLQQRALDLMLRLNTLLATRPEAIGSHQDVLLHGAGEMMGGLAQALGSDDFQPFAGLSVVQLKRALRGAAFAIGALFALQADGTLDEPAFKELHQTIEGLQTDMYAELSRLRQRREDEL